MTSIKNHKYEGKTITWALILHTCNFFCMQHIKLIYVEDAISNKKLCKIIMNNSVYKLAKTFKNYNNYFEYDIAQILISLKLATRVNTYNPGTDLQKW